MKNNKMRKIFIVLPIFAVAMTIFLYPMSTIAFSSETPDDTPADTESSNQEIIPVADNPSDSDADTGGSGNNAGADVPDLFDGNNDTGTGAVTGAGIDTESAIQDGGAFTPSGSGTMVDNATDADGKEFFTIEAADGSIFYLVIDRQRGTENVYFLNAVSKDDLLPLAEGNDSALPGIFEPEAEGEQATPAAVEDESPEDKEEPTKKEGAPGGIYIFILLAVLIAAGVGYYLKIYRPKKDAADANDYADDDDTEYDTDFSYEGEIYPEEYEDMFSEEHEAESAEPDIAGEESDDAKP